MAIEKRLRVLVTAGASGIGRTVVENFLAQNSLVHVCDISESHLADLATAFPAVGSTRTDVADEQQVNHLFEKAKDHLGGLNVLVNNAGIAGPTAPIDRIELKDWERTLAVNITGQFLCARRAVPLLKQAGGGSIVNVSSVAGRLGMALRAPYSASKWAVVGFTKTLAAELGPYGIRVNAILPGLVEGQRQESVVRAKARETGISYADLEEELLKSVSLRKKVSAQDVANMIVFLCSDLGNSVSGQAISVCGDLQYLS
jgi:NAD(P)-dependent dehydrogenase (short-subunit alcohol dehydrogenase family)